MRIEASLAPSMFRLNLAAPTQVMVEVRYTSGNATKARFLLSELGGAGKVLALNRGAPAGADIVLVLGRDYKGLTRPTPKTATSPASGPAPTSARSSGGSAAAGTSASSPAVGC